MPVKQYSAGMRIWLAFSVATEVDPAILMADEILSVGDLAFSGWTSFAGPGKAILFVTHSVEQVEDHCDRPLVLDSGSVAFDGNAIEAIEFYKSISAPEEAALATITQIL